MKATFLLMLLTIAPVQAQVLHLGTGKALELASTSVNLSGGRTLVVYETLTVVNSSVTGVRLSTCLLHDGRADANHPMESLNQQPLVGSPAGLVVDGKPYLYFVSAASEEAVPSLERVLVHDDGSVLGANLPQRSRLVDAGAGFGKQRQRPRYVVAGARRRKRRPLLCVYVEHCR
jgi:hypothetical protein